MTSTLAKRQEMCTRLADKYRDKPFDWAARVTCVHMAWFHLRNMGHKMMTIPNFRSAMNARRALKERGFANVMELLDHHTSLTRIAPAQMLIGDVAVVRSDDGLGSILVHAGLDRFFGWHEEGEAQGIPGMTVVIVPFENIDAAYRV